MVALLLAAVVGVVSAARAPSNQQRASLLPTPAWACPLTDSPSYAKVHGIPVVHHQLFASGNATKDEADAASIQKAAERLEQEESAKAKDLVKQANNKSLSAKEEAAKAASLDAKAKAEMASNKTAAQKDSEEALTEAKAAMGDSAGAQNLSSNALEIEKTAEVQSTKMFEIAAGLRKDIEKEQKQSVVAVDGTKLNELLDKEDLLVVFYAPWCPHCQTYVMADEAGDPEKAPVELLQKELKTSGGPQVVKFNVDAGQVPSDFQVKHIPTIFWASKAGDRVMFEGDPHDFKAIKDFVAAPHKAGAQGPGGPMITVLKQLRSAATLSKHLRREPAP